MKVLALATIAVVLCVVHCSDKRQLIGICVEECNPKLTISSSSSLLKTLGMRVCPDGSSCTSNGCGHVCQTDAPKCSGVMCAMFCENGFMKGDDGCPICKCSDVVIG